MRKITICRKNNLKLKCKQNKVDILIVMINSKKVNAQSGVEEI